VQPAFTCWLLAVQTASKRSVRVDILNKVLADLVGRTAPAKSETAGLLRLAWEHGQAIAETLEGEAGG